LAVPPLSMERRQRGLMKKAVIVFVVSLFALSGPAIVAGPASANNHQEKESISSIRERYAAINKNLSKYRVVKKELAGFSTEGGEQVVYCPHRGGLKPSPLGEGFSRFYAAC
jgi:hypothetical protein